ncbi:RagB/SusD family nutrient uptake outer membrane protein [Parapedobacter sp. 10938]|uniref:RagB/SusD family nutrient uptake outer membrane protein n=1 Tax=Parapedobacter flavus TaxID=3110225 RepID=UPI002DB6904B|nr:RagB/SusD family nutrient uptake outer membrane protein [Parapedobacter sp. 10938]MEC3878982.1 RagB/SusD family nutrient uptake outer membrane protein [Parapedobacter sp. 10938]
MNKLMLQQLAPLALGCLLLSGCSGFFEVDPYDAVKEVDFYKNREDLNAAAFGMYEPLSRDVHKFLLWGDARADMVTTGQLEPDPYINEFARNNVTVNNPYTNYAAIYETIARCNRQLERVYDVMATDDKLLERDAGAYYGEALLLRTYCYYVLARTFDRFPIIRSDYAEDIRFVNEQGDTVSRKTLELTVHEIRGLYRFPEDKQEVWQMLYNDVLTVLGILPLNYRWNRNSLPAQERYGRVSQPMANTLATELALWVGEYQSASAFANSPVINNNHSLGASGNWINQFTGSWAAQHSLFLLGYQYDRSFETNRLQEFTSPIAADGGRYHLKPVSHVINTIFSHEGEDIRTSFSYKVIGQDTVIWKYIGADNVSSMRPAYQSNASWHVYRSADAYLLKALADLMVNDYASAFNFLNMVREARGLEPLLPEEFAYTDKEFMMEQLFRERARELAFEGKRWYDLMLWSQLSGENKLAPHVASKYSGALREQVAEKLRFEQNWYLPVDPLLW